MRDEVIKLLDLRRLPGRLNCEQAAPLLGFAPHDLPVLVRAKLLKPLGNPQPQAVKYFSSTEIEKCARDTEWLHKATKAICLHWATENAKRRSNRQSSKGRSHLLAA